MNKTTTPTKFLVGSFIILIVLLVNILPQQGAQSNLIPSLKAEKSPTCDQTTVAGTYGFSGQGVIGFGTPESAQAVETGLATADGAGNLSGSVTFGLNGLILSTPFTGMYQVNPDCTISETIAFASQVRHQQGVIVNDSDEIDFIQTDPGSILTRTAKRISKKRED
jgi:hypothetical protein